VHLDLVIIGVHGMDVRSGFTSPNILEAETDRALIEAGRRLVVVADHTKWGVIGLSSIARLNQADVLITDSGLDLEAREALAGQVKELVVAEARPPALASRPAATEPVGSETTLVGAAGGRPVRVDRGRYAPGPSLRS
jgi:hypothetical protein